MQAVNYKSIIYKLEQELELARKENEQLTEYKTKFETLSNNFEDFVWVMNSQLELTYVSPSVYQTLGYTPEDFLSLNFFDICSPESAKLISEGIIKRRKGIASNTKKQWEFNLIHKNDSTVWLDSITTPIILGNGTFDGIIGVSRDITQDKIEADKRRKTEANLKAQVESTTNSLWSIDKEYRITTINQNFKIGFKIAFGIHIKIGESIIDKLPPSISQLWIDRYDRALLGEQYVDMDQYEINGETKYYEISFTPINVQNKTIGVACFSQDISLRKMAEIALIESENRYKTLVTNIPSVAYRCKIDDDWTMQFISDEIENLTGYNKTEFINNKVRSYASIIYPDDIKLVNEMVYHAIEQNESFSFSYRIIDSNGNQKWVNERGRAVHDKEGNAAWLDGVISDISFQKTAEHNLIQSENNYRLLNNATLELNNIESIKDIYKYICKIICEKYPQTIAIITEINFEKKSSQLLHMEGFNQTTIAKVFDILGFNPFNKTYTLIARQEKILKQGKLVRHMGGLSELSAKQIPKLISISIEKLIQINKVYSIGINKDNKLLAGIHLLSRYGTEISDTSFIDLFVDMVSGIIQRRHLTQLLKSSELKFKDIFDSSGSAISIQTADNHLLVNKTWERITEYTAKEAYELNPASIIHPQERDKIVEIAQNRLNGIDVPSNYEIHLITKSGNEKWIEIATSIINYEGENAILVIGNDVTNKKHVEREYIKLSTAVKHSPVSIVITDIDANIEYVNPFFTEFTGYTLDDVKNKNPRVLKSGNTPSNTHKDLWNTILTGNVWKGEFENRKKNGEIFWESARIAPIIDDDGIITHFIAIKEDISARKKSQKSLEESEKALRALNAKKDKFFSIIAHDLKSPFAGVVGLTGILKDNYDQLEKDKLGYMLSELNNSANNVLKLIENLLEWAKSQSNRIEFEPKNTNISELLINTTEIISLSAKNKEISIINHTPKNLFWTVDKNMLLTIVRNLISNAIKYTPRKGLIEIRTELINEQLQISVTDNGVGIPQTTQDKLFKIGENYSTNGTEKEKGTGLGLILCKEFVIRHRGKIWCESTLQKGSSFYFTIPKNK